MKNFAVRLSLTLALASFFTYPAFSQTVDADGAFSLQGRLTSGVSNDAVADGQYNLTIKVYEQGTGNVVLTENDMVMVTDGVFSTMVGNNSALSLETDADYEIGISVDGGAELTPRIMLGSAPNALTADVAADAEMVGGLRVSSNGEANTIIATDGQGRIDADLLKSSINVTGSGVSVNTDGGMLNLSISGGSGGGSFELPFSGSANVGTGESVLKLTAMGSGSAATLLNSGTGGALSLSANSTGSAALDITNNGGAAINAVGSLGTGAVLEVQNTSANADAQLINAVNAQGNAAFQVMGNGRTVINSTVNGAGSAALDVTNNAGAAISAVGSLGTGAVLEVQNTSTNAGAQLITAMNAQGNAAFQVMGNGRTVINSTVGNALEVGTTASGEAALRVNGGLTLNGPVGTATLPAGATSVTINNPLVNANSVIMLTVNSATSLTNGLRLSGQGNGSFTVSLLDSALGTLNGGLNFNYLIINTVNQ